MGEGPERASLERLAGHLSVPVTFLGWCDVEQRQAVMRGATILAVPSTSPETFAIVGLEAACVGLPAVAFAIGGVTEWLIDGVSGASVPGKTLRSTDFARAIVRAIGDPVAYERLRLGAWQVSQRFSVADHVGRLESVLRAAIDSSTVRRSM
jgi:glycosyltransferase involved in cell wall biosynthesis